MTNYHCVGSCVSALSDEKRNLQETGFYAAAPPEERRCPGMELNQLTAISDVTDRVGAATKGTEGERFGRPHGGVRRDRA